jgi:hypothetical protein
MKGRRKGWYKFEKKNSNVGQYQNTSLHDYIIEYQNRKHLCFGSS